MYDKLPVFHQIPPTERSSASCFSHSSRPQHAKPLPVVKEFLSFFLEIYWKFIDRRFYVAGIECVGVSLESLRAEVAERKMELRKLFEQDRAAGLAGTWLPEALQRKHPRGGEK
jgi:hypothetical protein